MRCNTALSQRLEPYFGSVFDEMTSLARAHEAINLGQGAPDPQGPPALLQSASAAILEGFNQYPPARGILPLRQAIVDQITHDYGLSYDPDTECIVTVGATEAITLTLLALVDPEDEVIVFEPFFESYAAILALIGARKKVVPLTIRDGRWDFDVPELEQCITSRTKMIIVNSPHNPTGMVYTQEQLLSIAMLSIEHDLLVMCDEVYEHLVYSPAVHIPLASLEGMRERTIRISSAGKTMSVTGWKIGWVCARSDIIDQILNIKQHATYGSGAPFQKALAQTLNSHTEWVAELRNLYTHNQQLLSAALADIGCQVCPSASTFFLIADVSPLGYDNGRELCVQMPQKIGVAAVPLDSLTVHHDKWKPYVRFSFAKYTSAIEQAIERLEQLRA